MSVYSLADEDEYDEDDGGGGDAGGSASYREWTLPNTAFDGLWEVCACLVGGLVMLAVHSRRFMAATATLITHAPACASSPLPPGQSPSATSTHPPRLLQTTTASTQPQEPALQLGHQAPPAVLLPQRAALL